MISHWIGLINILESYIRISVSPTCVLALLSPLALAGLVFCHWRLFLGLKLKKSALQRGLQCWKVKGLFFLCLGKSSKMCLPACLGTWAKHRSWQAVTVITNLRKMYQQIWVSIYTKYPGDDWRGMPLCHVIEMEMLNKSKVREIKILASSHPPAVIFGSNTWWVPTEGLCRDSCF